MRSVSAPVLFIAHDEEVAVVSTDPVGVVGGRADEYRWGRVLESTPADPGQARTAAVGYRGLGVLALIIGSLLNCFGAGWGSKVMLAGLIVVVVSSGYIWMRKTGVVAAPTKDCYLLSDPDDRKILSDAIDTCRRSARTWPALDRLIDIPAAEVQLALALLDIARVLDRRRHLRDLQDDLAAAGVSGSPTQNTALEGRAKRIADALREADDDLRNRLDSLTATATAGEAFVREQEFGKLTRDIDDALERLTAPGANAAPDLGAQLADQTETVLRAYRELDAQYGLT